MHKTLNWKKEFTLLLSIAIGSSLLAAGVAFFLQPSEITTGGTPGIALLIHYMTGISTGTAMLMVNIPLLLLGARFLDLPFALRSLFSMLVTATMVDVFTIYVDFPKLQSLMLATIYGGVLIGLGVGMVLKAQASVGGTTIIAKIVSNYFHLKPAQIIMFLDASIVIAIGILFADVERVLWSIVNIYVTTIVIDKILTGAVKEKIVHIVSDSNAQIGETISEQFSRDGTILAGTNLNQSSDKSILFVVVGARRIQELKKLVLEIDPKALMIVMEASEMQGSSKRFER